MRLASIMLVLGLILYLPAKWAEQNHKPARLSAALTPPSPLWLQRVSAGPCPGIASEYSLLRVFTLFDEILHPLPHSNQQQLYQNIMEYLRRAQAFDPWFFDIYRLTTGIAGFTPELQAEAVQILVRGGKYRTWDYEPLFIAGFIAHDQLNDDKLAFRLLKQAAQRPGAPPMLVGLAARFLGNIEGKKASIQFLRHMLETMPKDYRGPIQERIKRLQQENGGEA